MAAPLIVSFWMRAAFSLVDTAYASILGDAEIAAIGLTFPFEFFLIAVWIGLSTGLTSQLSSALGRGKSELIEQLKRKAWKLVIIVGPIFFLLGIGMWIFGDAFSPDDPELSRAFRIYATVMLSGAALTSFWSVVPDSLIKAHQDTKTTMWAGIWSNLLNVVLNTIFLFVFDWGIFGIALSTVIGRIGGLGYAIVKANAHERRRKASTETHIPGLDPHPYRSILSLAIPASMAFALMAGEGGLVNTLITRMDHATESLAAFSIYYRVSLFMMNPIIAISVAMLPYTAIRFGPGNFQEIKKGLRHAAWFVMAYTIGLVAPVILLTAGPLAAALAESPVTESLARTLLYLTPIGCLVAAPFLYVRPVFEGMNRGTPGLSMSILRYVFLGGPLALIGIAIATRLQFEPLVGLSVGLIIASALCSAGFLLWLNRELADKASVSA